MYLLEHQYSDASLRYEALKGADAVRARALKVATEDGIADIYLANVERTSMGDEGDDYLDEEGSTDLRRIVTLDGREVVSGMSFDGCEFVQGDPYQDREPDDEHHEGYTGNEGAPITYYYRDTV